MQGFFWLENFYILIMTYKYKGERNMIRGNLLAKALKYALLAENKNSGSVEIRCFNGSLNVIGNSGEITVISKIPCEGDFDVAVDGHLLLQAITPLVNQDIQLCPTKTGIRIATSIMSMEFYKCSYVKLKEHVYKQHIYVPNLICGLRETSHAIGSGTNFSASQFIDGNRVITLDGKRISIRGKKIDSDIKILLSEQATKTIRSVFADADELNVSVSETRIKVEGENCTVETSLLGEKFVDVDRILSNVHTNIIFKVMKCDLIDYVNTALIRDISLTFTKDSLLLSAPDLPQCGNYRVMIEGSYELEPEKEEVSRYDAKFLKEAIKSISSDEIYMKYEGPRSPLCITNNENAVEWIMPISTLK